MSNSVLQKVYISRHDYQMYLRGDFVDGYDVFCTDTKETEGDILIVVRADDLIFNSLEGKVLWYKLQYGTEIIAIHEPEDEETF